LKILFVSATLLNCAKTNKALIIAFDDAVQFGTNKSVSSVAL